MAMQELLHKSERLLVAAVHDCVHLKPWFSNLNPLAQQPEDEEILSGRGRQVWPCAVNSLTLEFNCYFQHARGD